jgi:hypothetical protein
MPHCRCLDCTAARDADIDAFIREMPQTQQMQRDLDELVRSQRPEMPSDDNGE